MKILVDDEEELAVIAQLREWATEGVGISEMAERLNAKGTKPPQGATWTKSLLYNLRLRLSHIIPKPHNERAYGDNEVKERILELRANGHSLRQIAAILNEQGMAARSRRGDLPSRTSMDCSPAPTPQSCSTRGATCRCC